MRRHSLTINSGSDDDVNILIVRGASRECYKECRQAETGEAFIRDRPDKEG